MAVPTHFYKVILAENKSQGGVPPSQTNADHIVGAFVLPNQPIDPTTPLTAFAVPLTALEQASGRSIHICHLCTRSMRHKISLHYKGNRPDVSSSCTESCISCATS